MTVHNPGAAAPAPAELSAEHVEDMVADTAKATADLAAPQDPMPGQEPSGVARPEVQAQAARHDDDVEVIRFVDVVSGQFDADEESANLPPPKRVLAPQAETPKLHKVLAQAGMGSRLEMEQLIMEGRISVNNEPAHIGQRIQFGDHVKVNGKPIRFRIDAPPPRVIAYHKPVGEVVTHDDPQNRPTVFRRLPKLYQGKWQSVGRLDLNTEGLLLLTSSGELANKLMHPRFGLEREYAVRVLGALSKDEKHKLLDGVKLDDGIAQFGSIEEGGGEGSNCWYRVTISEGRNREVRRMFEAVGHAVSRLIRIRYGAMVLPRGLKRGAWMELDESDIRSLTHAADVRGSSDHRADDGDLEEGGRPAREGTGPQPGNRNRRRGGPRGNNNGQRNAPANKAGSGGQGNASGAGQGRKDRADRGDRQAEAAQPDPMKTAFGYIGADSFTRQRQGQGQGQGQRRSGGGGGGGGGGGQRRGGRGR
jgi:23S rRNA pseudouridine2605 synthase